MLYSHNPGTPNDGSLLATIFEADIPISSIKDTTKDEKWAQIGSSMFPPYSANLPIHSQVAKNIFLRQPQGHYLGFALYYYYLNLQQEEATIKIFSLNVAYPLLCSFNSSQQKGDVVHFDTFCYISSYINMSTNIIKY
jgi:hypothetical protein